MNIFKYLTQSLAANGGHLAPDLTPPLMQASGLDYEDHLCMVCCALRYCKIASHFCQNDFASSRSSWS